MMDRRLTWVNDARYILRQSGVRRGLVVLAVALTLLVIAGIQYHRIVSNEIGGLRAQLEQKRHEAVDAQYAQQLVVAYSTGKNQIAVLEKKLQVQGVQSTLAHEMERLCKLDAVQLLAQSYQDGRAGQNAGMQENYAALQHELVVAGSYANLRRLISDMENLPTLSFIEEANFSKSSERDAQLKLVLRLVTYYRAETANQVK